MRSTKPSRILPSSSVVPTYVSRQFGRQLACVMIGEFSAARHSWVTTAAYGTTPSARTWAAAASWRPAQVARLTVCRTPCTALPIAVPYRPLFHGGNSRPRGPFASPASGATAATPPLTRDQGRLSKLDALMAEGRRCLLYTSPSPRD